MSTYHRVFKRSRILLCFSHRMIVKQCQTFCFLAIVTLLSSIRFDLIFKDMFRHVKRTLKNLPDAFYIASNENKHSNRIRISCQVYTQWKKWCLHELKTNRMHLYWLTLKNHELARQRLTRKNSYNYQKKLRKLWKEYGHLYSVNRQSTILLHK